VKRTIRVLLFALLAVVMLTAAGLPWVLLTGVELYWSPLVGAVALAISK
jgi:hypothetical protein